MSFAAQARDLLKGRLLAFGTAMGQDCREDREGFKRMVDLAVECGASHMHVGTIPFRYDNWVLPDRSDPYAAWCNHSASILRICPPPELQEWVSLDHARQLQEFIGWQLSIMRPHGLRAMAYAIEPLWLPEGVYRAHPNWRGAQCELGRIARRPYFAPSIDDPEVLDLYRRAMQELSTLFPEIDHYDLMSNDSGGGIAWTPNTYPGMNGPVKYRTKDGGKRIADWLKAIQDGAAAAGVKLRVNLHSSGFPPELSASAQRQCAPGIFVNWRNEHDDVFQAGNADLGGGLWSLCYPVQGLGNPEAFIAGLQTIYNRPEAPRGIATIRFREEEVDFARLIMQAFFEAPGGGSVKRAEILLRTAAAFCGSSAPAEKLVAAWKSVQRANHAVAQIRQKGFGHVLAFCGVSMRWLLRPLVPKPEALTKEETAHYEPFLFSVGSDADNRNLSLVLGKGVFRGESVMWMARWCLQEAYETLRTARKTVESIAATVKDGPGKARTSLLAAQIGAYACLVMNARNCIMYNYALSIADQPQFGPNPMDYDDNIIYDHRALALRKIAREELDNTYELIRLLEGSAGRVLHHAVTPEEESVFVLPVDLAGALQRKAEVMLDHWQDYEDLYPATKVWDYEPRPLHSEMENRRRNCLESAEQGYPDSRYNRSL